MPPRLCTLQAFSTQHHRAVVLLHLCAASQLHIFVLVFLHYDTTVLLPQPTHITSRLGNSAFSCYSVSQNSELTTRRLSDFTLAFICATSLPPERPRRLHSRAFARLRFCTLAQMSSLAQVHSRVEAIPVKSFESLTTLSLSSSQCWKAHPRCLAKVPMLLAPLRQSAFQSPQLPAAVRRCLHTTYFPFQRVSVRLRRHAETQQRSCTAAALRTRTLVLPRSCQPQTCAFLIPESVQRGH